MIHFLEDNSTIRDCLRQINSKELQEFIDFNRVNTLSDLLNNEIYIGPHRMVFLDLGSVAENQIADLKQQLLTFPQVVLFYNQKINLQSFTKIMENNILDVINLSVPKEMIAAQLKLLTIYLKTEREIIGPEDLKELAGDVNLILQKVEKEMERIKKLHTDLMPKRYQDFKGLHLLSKFASGESLGGEFFDLAEINHKMVFFLSSSNSYLTSTLILNAFNELKTHDDLSMDDLKKVISGIQNELNVLGQTKKKKKINLELMIGFINLKNLKLEGYNFGKNTFVSLDQKNTKHLIGANDFPVDLNFEKPAQFEIRLDRGAIGYFISSGVKKNCQDYLRGQDYLQFISKNTTLYKEDMLQEVFFELRKERDNEFLDSDATMIYMQVDPSMIIEV